MSRSKQPIYRRLIGTLVNVVRCVVSTFLPELVFSVLSHDNQAKTCVKVCGVFFRPNLLGGAPPAEPGGGVLLY